MAGSSYGTIFRITTWGESHGKGLGVVVDGCPAGLPLKASDIQEYLDRRRGRGSTATATQRAEKDRVEILSGVFEGKTTGTPISLMVPNADQRSRITARSPLPIVRAMRTSALTQNSVSGITGGGGRSSGRETIGRVAGGAVASLLLRELGITLCAYTRSIGPVSIENLRRTGDRKQSPENAGPRSGGKGRRLAGEMYGRKELFRRRHRMRGPRNARGCRGSCF